MRTVAEVPVDAAAELCTAGFTAGTDEDGTWFEYRVGRNLVRVEQDPNGWWAYAARTHGFYVSIRADLHETTLPEVVPAALRWAADTATVMRAYALTHLGRSA